MSDRKWFIAKESKRGDVRHLQGHERLGSDFTKCGKKITFDIIVREKDNLRGCKVCWSAYEVDKVLALNDAGGQVGPVGGDILVKEVKRLRLAIKAIRGKE